MVISIFRSHPAAVTCIFVKYKALYRWYTVYCYPGFLSTYSVVGLGNYWAVCNTYWFVESTSMSYRFISHTIVDYEQ